MVKFVRNPGPKQLWRNDVRRVTMLISRLSPAWRLSHRKWRRVRLCLVPAAGKSGKPHPLSFSL